ncbi:hypothetical protein HAX54_033456 [Datura stramonium]|uniref:Uncharacterized protein n=1 Tax=Datura stramonium TaxID=4076 RepID=A0ABS8VG46_DATST|nr:hypothetical protein [Datura stramonium]
MTQLFKDVRKNLPVKPHWMGDAVFKEMTEHWESPQFKAKSEQNKINRDANAVGGKKKERVSGLGSLGRSVKVPKQSISTTPNEVDEIRSQVHAMNSELYKRLEEAQHEN